MKQVIIKAAAICASMVISGHAFADAASDLKLKLEKINTFQAQFSQQVTDEEGSVLQQGAGNIALAHPLKIRWQQQQPDETLLVSDGSKTYYYDMFAEQVTVMKTTSLINTTPFVLLTTRADEQWSKYQVAQTDIGYKITPNEGVESQVEALELVFAEQDTLKSMSVKDVSGQVSTFRFEQSKLNTELDTALFSFTMPADVAVDDQTQGE
jgi:outer membrane lipoprotein carrier protein